MSNDEETNGGEVFVVEQRERERDAKTLNSERSSNTETLIEEDECPSIDCKASKAQMGKK